MAEKFEDIEPYPSEEYHRATIYFLHGFNGHGRTTWQSHPKIEESFWPLWLAKRFPNIKIVSVHYDSPALKDSLSIESKVDWLNQTLRQREKETGKPFFLVCHSMGGILAKRLILKTERERMQDVHDHFRGVIFFSTPHGGSSLVEKRWFRHFIAAQRHRVLKDLSRNGSYLKLLQDMYLAFLERRDKLGLRKLVHRDYHESKNTAGVKIVESDAATMNLPNEPVDGEQYYASLERPFNHLDICKFDTIESDLFGKVIESIELAFKADVEHEKAQAEALQAGADTEEARKGLAWNAKTSVLFFDDSYAPNLKNDPQPEFNFWQRYGVLMGGKLTASVALLAIWAATYKGDFIADFLKPNPLILAGIVLLLLAIVGIPLTVLCRKGSIARHYFVGLLVILLLSGLYFGTLLITHILGIA